MGEFASKCATPEWVNKAETKRHHSPVSKTALPLTEKSPRSCQYKKLTIQKSIQKKIAGSAACGRGHLFSGPNGLGLLGMKSSGEGRYGPPSMSSGISD